NRTQINGTINITVNHNVANTFTMYRCINQTAGGTISVQSPGKFDMQKDTVNVNSVSVAGYKNSDCIITGNSITGNVSTSDDATNSFTTWIRSNLITGNNSFTVNGT